MFLAPNCVDPRTMSPKVLVKRARSPSAKSQDSSHKSKKLRLLSSYTATSPFPNFTRPTAAECTEIHDLLSAHHRSNPPTRRPPQESSNSAETCGSVPNVIESLIGTILSQATSAQNSTAAKRSLDEKFGRNDFAAIVEAPRADVMEAIKCGGLANKKAKTIRDVIKAIKEKHGDYSLQHLMSEDFTDDDIMAELVSYDGVGPKTASCVLLFCLGRDSFAVDTHVYRLSKLLGWVPEKADRVLAQAHLDLRVPNELKYGLHVLFVQHGRVCTGCKNSGKGNCVLKTYLKERKGVKDEKEVEEHKGAADEDTDDLKEED